jgi:hypothetical protein
MRQGLALLTRSLGAKGDLDVRDTFTEPEEGRKRRAVSTRREIDEPTGRCQSPTVMALPRWVE